MSDIEKANYEAKQARNNESAEQLLGLYFPVLDHGFVSLVDFMGSDAGIAQAARCSYGAGTRAVNDDRALIRYLIRHKHTSPLEQVELKFHCVSGDTRISTNLGVIKIEDAINASYAHNTVDVSECGVIKSGKKKLYKLNLDRGFSIKITSDHKLRVLDNTASLVWKSLEEILDDDYLLLSSKDTFFCEADHIFNNFHYDKKTHKSRVIKFPKILTKELAELVGYYMGDGSCSNETLEFPVSDKYPQIVTKISNMIKQVFDVEPSQNSSDGMIKIRLNSVEAVAWWRANGLSKTEARDAFIPECFWSSKKEMAFAFFAGLFGADGSVSETNGVSLTTTSKRLAEETQTLMAFLGIPMTKLYRPDNYILYTFTNNGLQRYRKYIGFTCQLKQEKLSKLELLFSRTEAIPHAKAIIEKYGLNRNELHSQYYSGCNLPRKHCPDDLDENIYLSIQSIEPLGEEDVWDISVPKTEMFQANGIIVHNCKMPIFVARQWVRHRTASLNEMSGRYSVMPLQFYTPKMENFSYQSKDNKQGRSAQTEANSYNSAVTRFNNTREHIKDNYEWLLKEDVARELARIDLPLSTYTEWYWKIDLHNLMHFLRLRCDSHAQYEIRVFADIMAGMVKMVTPAAYEAWLDYSIGSENFSFQEMQALYSTMQSMASSGSISCIEEEFMFNSDEHKKEWGQKFGMTLRETNEFIDKISQKKTLPSFNLDLSVAKTPEYFRQEAEKYVPSV